MLQNTAAMAHPMPQNTAAQNARPNRSWKEPGGFPKAKMTGHGRLSSTPLRNTFLRVKRPSSHR